MTRVGGRVAAVDLGALLVAKIVDLERIVQQVEWQRVVGATLGADRRNGDLEHQLLVDGVDVEKAEPVSKLDVEQHVDVGVDGQVRNKMHHVSQGM